MNTQLRTRSVAKHITAAIEELMKAEDLYIDGPPTHVTENDLRNQVREIIKMVETLRQIAEARSSNTTHALKSE